MAIKASEREGRRHALGLRTTKAVRERLDRAASIAGRSLTQEIEFRLERSFRDDDVREMIREVMGPVRIESEAVSPARDYLRIAS